jgi:hypothetical protein
MEMINEIMAQVMNLKISFVIVALWILSMLVVGKANAVDVLIHDAPYGSDVIITVNSTDYTDYKTMTVQTNDSLNVTFDVPQGLDTVTACAHVQQQAEHLGGCSSGLGTTDSKLDVHLQEMIMDNHEKDTEDHAAEEESE